MIVSCGFLLFHIKGEMGMRKKLLSLIISLVMVLTMVPMMGNVVYAAEAQWLWPVPSST